MSEYYVPPVPEKLGNPALDPPMVVRVQPGRDPRSPDARRAIRTDAIGAPWFAVTGQGRGRWLTDRTMGGAPPVPSKDWGNLAFTPPPVTATDEAAPPLHRRTIGEAS